jgi:hypothetical protein
LGEEAEGEGGGTGRLFEEHGPDLDFGGGCKGGGIVYDDQTAHVGQVHVQRFQCQDFDAPCVEALWSGARLLQAKGGGHGLGYGEGGGLIVFEVEKVVTAYFSSFTFKLRNSMR